MAEPQTQPGTRHSILELAPLELDCMNALWALGEATVRDIQHDLAPTRPRAYTTIMTILDRLASKGVVDRHKVGRSWKYRAHLSPEAARSHAVAQVVQGFFGGSAAALSAHLASAGSALRTSPVLSSERLHLIPAPPRTIQPRDARAVLALQEAPSATANAHTDGDGEISPEVAIQPPSSSGPSIEHQVSVRKSQVLRKETRPALDTTLL